MEGQISENVCKLYLSQNLVIIHPSEFNKKEDMINYALKMIKDGKKNEFKKENTGRKSIEENKNIKR